LCAGFDLRGWAAEARAYARSCARIHAGLEAPGIPIDESALSAAFDDDPEWRSRYRSLIEPDNVEGPPKRALAAAENST